MATIDKSGSNKKASRRLKLTVERIGAYLDRLRNGLRRGAAAKAVGVTRETIRVRMLTDLDFAAAVDQAELDANEIVEDALFKQAKKGNVTAIQVWLYNRWPERWKDQRNIGKQEGMELFLATLPAELARSLREALAGPQSAGSPEVPPASPWSEVP